MTNKKLIKKLEQAYQVCRDCGFKYGVYSVGCSSVWEGVCNVCGETKGVTETRDYGYLMTGIRKLKLEGKDPAPQPKTGDTWLRDDDPAGWYTYDGTEWVAFNKETIKEQSKEVAEYMFTQTQESEHDTRLEAAKQMLTQEPIMTDDELDGIMVASYEEGELTCKFTEAEVTALAEVLNAHEEEHPPGWNVDYDSAFEKVMELYGDNCVKYQLSPAMKAYNAKYGTFGFDSELDTARWEGFREAFVMNAEVAK